MVNFENESTHPILIRLKPNQISSDQFYEKNSDRKTFLINFNTNVFNMPSIHKKDRLYSEGDNNYFRKPNLNVENAERENFNSISLPTIHLESEHDYLPVLRRPKKLMSLEPVKSMMQSNKKIQNSSSMQNELNKYLP